jgi:MFS transporter, ACS family, glucarate transporter
MSKSVMRAGTGTPATAPSADQVRTNYRWILAFLAFAIAFTMYIDRVNIAVAAPGIMQELHFTKVQLGMLSTVFFFAYALSQVPSGTLIELFGHRTVVSLALAWWSFFTAATSSCVSFTSWVVVRALFGIGEAPGYPGLIAAMQKWLPKWERGRAVGMMLLGSKVAPAVATPVAALLMISFGWRSIFWAFGGLGLLFSVVYFIAIRTYPHQSRFVNKAELDYIHEGKPFSPATVKKEIAPWGQILRSPQFWALSLQNSTSTFCNNVFIAWLPVYLLEAHQFSLKEMGFAAAIPDLAFGLGSLASGWFCDYLIGRKITNARVRAWVGVFGQLMFCASLYLTVYTDGRILAVVWLSMALGCQGLSVTSTWASPSDLGGRFSASVAGGMNFVANMFGATAPVVIGWVATEWGWQAAILVTAINGIGGACCWLFVRPDRAIKGCE